jgi:nitrogen fixation protein FixH
MLLGCSKKESQPPQAQTAASSSPADAASPWRMDLRISPDRPSMTKPMTFQIHIVDEHGQPVNDAQVNGALTMKMMDMGTTTLPFASKGNGDYEASRKNLDMSGPWNLAVDASAGSVHARKNFDVIVFD